MVFSFAVFSFPSCIFLIVCLSLPKVRASSLKFDNIPIVLTMVKVPIRLSSIITPFGAITKHSLIGECFFFFWSKLEYRYHSFEHKSIKIKKNSHKKRLFLMMLF